MRLARLFLINTAVAAVCVAVFYVGYTQGWLSAHDTNAPKL
jgi:hypothetical protein